MKYWNCHIRLLSSQLILGFEIVTGTQAVISNWPGSLVHLQLISGQHHDILKREVKTYKWTSRSPAISKTIFHLLSIVQANKRPKKNYTRSDHIWFKSFLLLGLMRTNIHIENWKIKAKDWLDLIPRSWVISLNYSRMDEQYSLSLPQRTFCLFFGLILQS